MRLKLLITGPCGRVGTHLVPLLREEFALRLFDMKPMPVIGDDEVIQGDIQDFATMKNVCTGVDALLHLAAVPDEDDFETRLLPMNLRGGYNAFEAARQAGVRKVIFTSTGQTVLNYGRGTWVSPDMPVRPITIYACTKVFGEALGRHYSDVHGLSVICIRLCWFQGYNSPLLRSMPEMHREWCSPRDLAQLVTRCLRTDVRFAIFFGISNNTGRYFDITNARELVGYDPQDDAVAQFGGKASGER